MYVESGRFEKFDFLNESKIMPRYIHIHIHTTMKVFWVGGRGRGEGVHIRNPAGWANNNNKTEQPVGGGFNFFIHACNTMQLAPPSSHGHRGGRVRGKRPM